MHNKLFKRAIDPLQYDADNVFWSSEIGLDSPTRKFFYDYLKKYKRQWINADILDVGCGTGWLLDLLKKNGARSVEGVEPSKKSVKIAKKLFPDITIHNCDFQSFKSRKKYNLIISIMTFGQIGSLDSAFIKVYDLLKPNGELEVAIPAYEYFKKPRYDYVVEIEEINNDEYITQTRRKHWGLIAEIVRKPQVYIKIAKEVGFSLIETIPMTPTKALISIVPRYNKYKNEPITYLLRFKAKNS